MILDSWSWIEILFSVLFSSKIMAGFFCNKAGMKRNDLWLLNEKSLCSFWTPHWLYLNLPPLLHSLHSVRLLSVLSLRGIVHFLYLLFWKIVWNLATLRNFFWSMLIKSRVWDSTRFWLINILKDSAALFTRYHKKYRVKFSQKSNTVSQNTGH